ncbi:MAG TPA: squalene/phytoene synthase family protein, partial [Micavibrio sp.]
MSEKLPYTGTLARQYDPDRFFLTLLQPAALRPALWALIAFHYEVAKTREVVSEPTLGFMRLQWWRENIEKICNGAAAPAHEVLQPLAAAIGAYQLPFALFDRLITAREFDLEQGTPESLPELVKYLSDTVTPLTELMLKVCGQDATGAGEISIAYGLAGVMRAIPFHARQGRCMVPPTLADIDMLFSNDEKRRAALVILHNMAAQSLVDAGLFHAPLLKHMAKAADLYLSHMNKLDYDVRDARFD